MPTQTLTVNWDSSSDAAFRAWTTIISTALATAGFVQTADTGQINLTTVTHPTVANTVGGYQIWRFADSVQSSAPIYFKLEYGVGSSASLAQMWITVGTGSNGSGTLTTSDITDVPAATAARQAILPSTASFGSHTIYLSTDGSALLLGDLSVVSTGSVFLLERTRAFDGTAVGDGYVGLLASFTSSGGASSVVYVPYIPGIAQQLGWFPAGQGGVQPAPTSSSLITLMYGTTVYTVPVMTGYGVKLGGPSQFLMLYMFGDYPRDVSVTMSHYGVSRTWRTAGIGNATSNWGSASGMAYGCKSFLIRIS